MWIAYYFGQCFYVFPAIKNFKHKNNYRKTCVYCVPETSVFVLLKIILCFYLYFIEDDTEVQKSSGFTLYHIARESVYGFFQILLLKPHQYYINKYIFQFATLMANSQSFSAPRLTYLNVISESHQRTCVSIFLQN